MNTARPVFAWAHLSGVVLFKIVLHAVFIGDYGFHRDELYYVVCGRELDWGYVDHPPLVPLLARAVEMLAGTSLVALRLVSVALGAAVVFFAGLIARELGGRAWAQGLAALAVAVAPVFLLTNHLFQTVTPDQVVWVVCSWLVLRILSTGRERLWLAVGLICGLGLLAKYTVALFGLALAIGLAATPWRRSLRSRWLWAGVALALACVAPNLLWQHEHGWPSAEFIVNRGARTSAEMTPLSFLAIQLAFIGGISLPLFAVGVAHLFGARGGPARVLGWIWLVVTVLLTALEAKPYYPAPIYPIVLAAGAVWTEAWIERRGWRRWRTAAPVALVLGQIPLVWMVLPVVPREVFARHQDAWPHKEFREMFGWEELAAQVETVYRELPAAERARATLLTESYGEAAALELFGPAHGLPRVFCGHNNYFYWGPPTSDVLVAVAWSRARLEPLFEEVVEIAPLSNKLGIVNESSCQQVFVCRRPRRPWPELWAALRSFV
jgi:4-amino-4-deoxy-L-arabinose transferase-like glycosyltransferase